METLIANLGPAFVIGLALQALFEWIDGPIIESFLLNRILRWSTLDEDKKKAFKSGLVRTLAIVIGISIAISLRISVLKGFEQFQGQELGLIDYVVAGLVISMGTDGINQIVKFVEKAKEKQAK